MWPFHDLPDPDSPSFEEKIAERLEEHGVDLTLAGDDRRHFRELLDSPGWRIYDKYLMEMIRIAKDEALLHLSRTKDYDEFLKWSGRIEALDRVAMLPDVLLDVEQIEEARAALHDMKQSRRAS